MIRPLGIGFFILAVVLGGTTAALLAQRSRAAVDFLDEKLKIPDSARFTEAEFTQSGVGLSFGVDKRLSYMIGRYDDAARRFEDSAARFPYKSEIWVFLARSYFHMKAPEKALAALDRAAAQMPDLDVRLWEPLRQSLLGHIRQRAARLQIQADFYSGTPDQFLSLFRLYKFLDDLKGTGGVILAAEAKAEGMKERAITVSAAHQTIYRNESRQWQDLAEQLRAELDEAGLAAPPAVQRGLSMAEAEAAELREKTRLLQLRVDFYQAVATEYQALFDNYLLLNLADRAAVVVERLDERIQRVRWLAQAASQAQDETEYLDEALALDKMKEQMNRHLLSLQPQPASP